ncbi:pyruvate dehydrogenase (acetyl-transferring) E1 component subunit alpha [Candidatus Fokinia crypta]|uniref:Pyruvate dehydrogenase E1 component subunit alpha n=1 Tax=Candidatus Fokinia crypta TaxID=1920990 RepID=A0ABZ0UPW5_9RICK|nr:pyruvate dehydrogenase (acetyl-transferring) E1 component subunit alpha [Candidatus Fokinia cryptica]WPX98151.1 Pyruvate dehydrogenase E1 component subunit alpha [Candidatus Fokinia cryptica]
MHKRCSESLDVMSKLSFPRNVNEGVAQLVAAFSYTGGDDVTSKSCDVERLLLFYEKALLLRRFEEKAGQMYGIGAIGGFCHLYIGQEAVAVGLSESMVQGDAIITSYRDHGMMLAVGSEPNAIMAELLGKATGCSAGKGGSMHMFDIKRGFYGGHGIVGAQVSVGTGIAMSMKYQKKNAVCFVVMGDGAVNQGQVYEAFNMAKLWNIPVVYIIENNEYGMGTSVNRASSTPSTMYARGMSFNIPGFVVNGMDVEEVYHRMSEARDYVISGSGPVIVECKTYRYRGHSMSDPAKYRTKEEVEEYKSIDPIVTLRNKIVVMSKEREKDLMIIDEKVKSIVHTAVKFAEDSGLPDGSTLCDDVYAV